MRDLNNDNRFLRGYGYNEIIPAMDLVHRRGTDGTNENPHNFIFYILARGGIIQLLLFAAFYIQLLKLEYKIFLNKKKISHREIFQIDLISVFPCFH